MAIEINKEYSMNDLAQELNISYRTLTRNAVEINGYLRDNYNFTTRKEGKKIYYYFHEQYDDKVEPYKHKTKPREEGSSELLEQYREIVDKEIERNPIFTPSSLAEDLIDRPAEHSVRTGRLYISKVLEENMYVSSPVWAIRQWNIELYRQEWVEAPEDILEEYFALVGNVIGANRELITLERDWRDGNITNYKTYNMTKTILTNQCWNTVRTLWHSMGKPTLKRVAKWEKGAF